MTERAFFRDSYGPKIQEIHRQEALPLGIKKENRERIAAQVEKTAGQLMLGGGEDGGSTGGDAGAI